MFGVIDVALGFAWHTGYRIRHFWRWKREGALVAAALVSVVGAADVARRGLTLDASSAHPAIAADPQPAPDTVEKAGVPAAVVLVANEPRSPRADALGALIESQKLYNEPATTGAARTATLTQ